MDASKSDDKFSWRSQGGSFEIGGEDDGGISAMIKIHDDLFIVSRKGIYTLILADTIDPKRTNPNVRHAKQQILPFGSDDPFVGRTLLQAEALFKDGFSSMANIDSSDVLNIAFSFLKEVIALRELADKYIEEEKRKNESFEGKAGRDGTISIPTIPTVEQQTKQFILNSSHAVRHIMKFAQLFYPDITDEKWVIQLRKKLELIFGKNDSSAEFVEHISPWIWMMRNLRNAVEHEKKNDFVKIKNYRSTETNIHPPTILYENKDTPVEGIGVSRFMIGITENLVNCFEMIMAHLCNSHAKSPGDITLAVIELPIEKRESHEINVRFRYHMVTKK